MKDCIHNPSVLGQDCINNLSSELREISPRDQPWDDHRAAASRVEQLYQAADYMRYSARVKDCSLLLKFILQSTDGELKLKLSSAFFCRLRHCPVCQWRRSMMWRARFLAALPQISERYPTHRWIFLTLTVRNCPIRELRQTLNLMNLAWKKLSKRSRFPGIGFVKATEITRSAEGEAHPHFHCLILVPASYFSTGYVTHSELSELWKQSLQVDYTPIVHVTAVKSKGSSKQNSQLIKAVLETLKYSVKVTDLIADSEWLAELTRQTHKTRAISVGGCLREFLSEDDPEDLVNPEGEQYEELLNKESELWFTWQEIKKRYTKYTQT